MISWWMLNPGPKTKMLIVIKRKLITLLKLITSMQLIKIFKLSWQYIRGILRKVGLIDLIVFPYYFLVYKNLIKKKFPINPQATETQFTLEGDNNFFRENQECYMYSNIKELNSKIEFIIKNSTYKT